MFTSHYILHFILFLSCLSYNPFFPHSLTSYLPPFFIFIFIFIFILLQYHIVSFTSHPHIISSPPLNNSYLITSQRRGLNATGKATKQQMDLGGAKEVLANRVRNQSHWKTRKASKSVSHMDYLLSRIMILERYSTVRVVSCIKRVPRLSPSAVQLFDMI